jgi:hypothetical protein
MDNALLQLGVGGIFALMVIDRVLTFLGRRKTLQEGLSLTAGERSVEFWQRATHEAAADAVSTLVLPILHRQTEILGKLEQTTSREVELLIGLRAQLEEQQRFLSRGSA